MTITTVGYGDIFPRTLPGKMIAMFAAIWGAFLVSIAVITVGNMFELNETHTKAHQHILLSQQAAISINSAAKFYMAKKKYYVQKLKSDPCIMISSPYL